MRGSRGIKEHWAPGVAVSWPVAGSTARVFHTGAVAVCKLQGSASYQHEELRRVDCRLCLRIAAKARYDATLEPVECVTHTDCRESRELGIACSMSKRTAQSNGTVTTKEK